MSKRTSGRFKRRKQDAYDTPPGPIEILAPHLNGIQRYIEPCAGKGNLIDSLRQHGFTCAFAGDLTPRRGDVYRHDARQDRLARGIRADAIITNPPWTREILHLLIMRWSCILPTWLLFDADWSYTKQSARYMDRCSDIVAVGRVSWMQNGTSGLDNCAWYRFHDQHVGGPKFHPPIQKPENRNPRESMAKMEAA